MQVNIRKNWRADSALRCSAICQMIPPIFTISRFEQFPNQLDEPCVFDFAVDDAHQRRMVYVIKTAFDVALHEPADAIEAFLIDFSAV